MPWRSLCSNHASAMLPVPVEQCGCGIECRREDESFMTTDRQFPGVRFPGNDAAVSSCTASC